MASAHEGSAQTALPEAGRQAVPVTGKQNVHCLFIGKHMLKMSIHFQLKKVLMAQGYGRHSQAEIEEITGKDLMALST
jgi:hypothetical protein